MTQSAVVKRDIQKRYDDLGEIVRKNLDVLRDPSRVWRLVEGDRPALAYFRRRKIETAPALGHRGRRLGKALLDGSSSRVDEGDRAGKLAA